MLPASVDDILCRCSKGGSLKVGVFHVPRVEDNAIRDYQRLHSIDTSRPGVVPPSFSALPLFGVPETLDQGPSGSGSSTARQYVTCLEGKWSFLP
jgi:hypothetical protein